MDPMLVQRSRYVLKSRVTRALRCPSSLFTHACLHLTQWLDAHPVFGPLVSASRLRGTPRFDAMARVAGEIAAGANHVEPGQLDATTIEDHADGCIAAVYAAAGAASMADNRRDFLIQCLADYLAGEDMRKPDENLEIVRDVALDGLYEYLDEQIDSRNALASVLLKYQHRCEWFRRSRLRNIAAQGLEHEKGGERALAIDLQEYVYNQGVEFVIEPVSATGEVDLVLRDPNDRHLILDAKYIPADAPPSEVKRKLAHGFSQVAKYCGDYQEPSGFMVVFSNHPATFALPLQESDGFKYLRLGNAVIYYVEVSIADTPSASKIGKATQITITREELVAPLTDNAQ